MKRIESIVIPLPLAATKRYKDASLNKYVNAERSNRFSGSSLKKQATKNCMDYALSAAHQGLKWGWPARLVFHWHMPDKRIDPDNMAFQKKYILDGLQDAKVLPNDSIEYVRGFRDDFSIEPSGHGYVEIKQERSE
ncbi:hypothetical protein [Schleiferilactobacillus perolens]|nr:hypothetical protein [Schleiferilactobacillus perolens]